MKNVCEWNYSWPESCVWFSILSQGFLWLVGRLDLEALGARSTPLTPLKKRQRNKQRGRERERVLEQRLAVTPTLLVTERRGLNARHIFIHTCTHSHTCASLSTSLKAWTNPLLLPCCWLLLCFWYSFLTLFLITCFINVTIAYFFIPLDSFRAFVCFWAFDLRWDFIWQQS